MAKRPGKPGGIRDTNRRKRSQALLDSALTLFLERGIEGVSIDDITRSARMAKGSFYRYYEDQPDLVAVLMEPVRTAMEDALKRCSRECANASTPQMMFAAYERLSEAIKHTLVDHTGLVRLYLQEGRAPRVGSRGPIGELALLISRYSIEITEKAQTHGILKPIPPEVSALAVIGAVERLLLAVLADEVSEPLEVPSHLITLILDGLKLKT